MIGRLTGKVLSCAPGQVLVDVSGVGYEVQIPLSTFYALTAGGEETVSLHVHTHVREDALVLFGFSSRDERWVFERLIGISGVGPRLALAILSGIGVEELRLTVERQDRARLEQIPGIGRKTAERLLLELRDKLRPATGRTREEDGSRAGWGAQVSDVEADAVSALVNLGYSSQSASKAVAAAAQDGPKPSTLEAVLKRALGALIGERGRS